MLSSANAPRSAEPRDHALPGRHQHREVPGDHLHEVEHVQDEGEHEAGAPRHLDHLYPHGAALRQVYLTFLSRRKFNF